MVTIYTTILGKKITLVELSPEQKELLQKALNHFKSKEEWGTFCNKVAYNDNAVKILGGNFYNGGYWITEEVLDAPLYQVLEDMEQRLGIEQGKLRQDDRTYWDFTENEKALLEILK